MLHQELFAYLSNTVKKRITCAITTLCRPILVKFTGSAALPCQSTAPAARPPLLRRKRFGAQGKKRDTQYCVSRCWRYLFSRAVASQVLSAGTSLTTVFGMGTGGPSAKSALLRFRLRQKLRTLPCSSFSSRIRFAGFRSDQDLRLYVIRSSGEHPVLYCLFRALSRGSLFDLQTSAAFEDREGKAAEGVSFRTSCGSKRSAACFDVVTRTGFEPMLTA